MMTVEITMDKKRELEKKIRYQVECEKKAHLLVQQLLDNPITEEFLLQSGQSIKPEHYEDVTEERAISLLCGYPICPNTLTSVPKQRYHISTRTNKVYDIKQRKNFCSNECYNASKFFLTQLSSSPLWTRKDEAPLELSLLPASEARGKCGEEVVSVSQEIKKEVKVIEKPSSNDRVKPRDEELSDPNQLKLDKLTLTDQRESAVSQNNTHSKNTEIDIDSDGDGSDINNGGHISEKSKFQEVSAKHHKDKKSNNVTNDSMKCEGVVQNSSPDGAQAKMAKLMSLLDKRKHLLGKMAQIENVTETKGKRSSEKIVEDVSVREDLKSDKTSNNVSKKVDGKISFVDEHKCSAEVIESVKTAVLEDKSSGKQEKSVQKNMSLVHHHGNTLPQVTSTISVMRCISRAMKLWVTQETRTFLRVGKTDTEQRLTFTSEMEEGYRRLCRRLDTGDTELDLSDAETEESDVSHGHRPLPDYEKLRQETEEYAGRVQNFFGNKEENKQVIKENVLARTKRVYLPSVDSHDQMLIRQKIVMERLHKVMPDFLPPLKLSIQDVFTPLKQLVATFSLSSKNILFKPAEWTLVGLLLLKMLACKELGIACAFMNLTAVQYFTILLQGVGDNLENIDRYVTEILSD